MSTIYDWSLNATNNANADEGINWTEGQLPSSVNNSARAMMQRIREFVADLSGSANAGGTANNIIVTSASAIAAYHTGIIMRFRALESNTDTVMLRLNNLVAKPVFKTGNTGIVPLSGGEIQRDGIYELIYNQLLNSGTGGWLLSAPTPPRIFPAGMIVPFAAVTPPDGWLACNGAEITRAAYADLFAVIGTTYGEGDGKTTFSLPDYRGMFLRGWDNGRGIDSGRTFGKQQDSENKEHTHGSGSIDIAHYGLTQVRSQITGRWDFRTGSIPTNDAWSDLFVTGGVSGSSNVGLSFRMGAFKSDTYEISASASGGHESRPVNMAVAYIIKT